MTTLRRQPEAPASLDISREKLAAIILKAHAFDAQAGVSDPDEGSNESDDRAVSVLEGQADDPTAEELRAYLIGLSADEQVALVALAWVGRGDFDGEDWQAARTMARERHTGSTTRYLMGMPLLGDYLEEGAAALGFNTSSDEFNALYHPDKTGAKRGSDGMAALLGLGVPGLRYRQAANRSPVRMVSTCSL